MMEYEEQDNDFILEDMMRVMEEEAHRTSLEKKVNKNVGTLKRKQEYRSIIQGERNPQPLQLELDVQVDRDIYEPFHAVEKEPGTIKSSRKKDPSTKKTKNKLDQEQVRKLRAERLRRSSKQTEDESDAVEKRDRRRQDDIQDRKRLDFELEERRRLQQQRLLLEKKRRDFLQQKQRNKTSYEEEDPSLDGTHMSSTYQFVTIKDLQLMIKSLMLSCANLDCIETAATYFTTPLNRKSTTTKDDDTVNLDDDPTFEDTKCITDGR